jgi:hypothetical protein
VVILHTVLCLPECSLILLSATCIELTRYLETGMDRNYVRTAGMNLDSREGADPRPRGPSDYVKDQETEKLPGSDKEL